MAALILILLFAVAFVVIIILLWELRIVTGHNSFLLTQNYQYGAKINKLTEENEALSQYIALAVRNVKSLMKH